MQASCASWFGFCYTSPARYVDTILYETELNLTKIAKVYIVNIYTQSRSVAILVQLSLLHELSIENQCNASYFHRFGHLQWFPAMPLLQLTARNAHSS